MNDLTKEDLQEYIEIRRNAINEMFEAGVIPGFVDTIEIQKMQAVLEEFILMEQWFGE